MKRIVLFFIMLAVVIGIGQAQSAKKVAVWQPQSYDNSITPEQRDFVRNCFEEALSTGLGYTIYNRNSFDSLVNERGIQSFGSVDKLEMKQLGWTAGVRYIIMSEAMTNGKDFFIIVRMFDVGRGEFLEVRDGWCIASEPEIKNFCFKLVAKQFKPIVGRISYRTARPIGPRNDERKDSTITITVGDLVFTMVPVEAGSFVMGCTGEHGEKCPDNAPAHKVSISRKYFIGQYEVTQKLYEAVMDTNPSRWQDPDRPVEQVSWYDAQEFCARLSRLTGRKFSLPTEAEWEYAARGGKQSKGTLYSGDSVAAQVAWYRDNGGEETHAVGTLKPNELGIYDMSGNVSEWCLDRMGKYGKSGQVNPKGPDTGAYRVLRGGSWFDVAECSRTMRRDSAGPSYRNSNFGFRIVLH